MLDLYFKYPKVLTRLRDGALGNEMDRIAAHFSDLGYNPASAKIYIGRLAKFSEFATRDAGTAKIDQDVVDRFLLSFRTESPRVIARTAIGHARKVAPERFVAPCHQANPDGPLLAAYQDHLLRVRGLEPRTCEGLLTSGHRILAWIRDNLPDQSLAKITGEHVLALVQHFLSLTANDSTRSAATSHVRAFLRFLRWSGLNDQDLARLVPRTPCWRLAHLPPRLAWEDIQRAIDAIDVTTPSGIRDRAIMLVLATTGLRNKELRALELQDIRWRTSEVLVRRTKGKRNRVRAALERSRRSACELHSACQAEGRQSPRVPVVCSSGAPVQVRRLNFEDCPFAIGTSRD